MRPTLIACLTLVAAGCSPLTGPDEDRHVGIVAGIRSDDPHITVPDTVQAGQSFAVTVRTYGLSSCWRRDGTRARVDDLEASVTPFDVERTEAVLACLGVIQDFSHTAMVSFERPGSALVIVSGRELPGGHVVDYTRAVVVQ